jgi:hypothetical protein
LILILDLILSCLAEVEVSRVLITLKLVWPDLVVVIKVTVVLKCTWLLLCLVVILKKLALWWLRLKVRIFWVRLKLELHSRWILVWCLVLSIRKALAVELELRFVLLVLLVAVAIEIELTVSIRCITLV